MSGFTLHAERSGRPEAKDIPEYAERLAARLAEPSYRRLMLRRIRLSIGAVIVSVVTAAIALAVLVWADLTPAAGGFTVLCFALSVGVFGIAEVTLLGGLVSHLAMQRLALGQKDVEIFEATKEFEELRARVDALAELAALTVRTREGKPAEAALLKESLTFVRWTYAGEPREALRAKSATITEAWKARGADEYVLAQLTIPGSVATT